jgi:hypothetical protein
MIRAVVLTLSLLAACSSGPSNPCFTACEKQAQCARTMDCSKVDPLGLGLCAFAKTAFLLPCSSNPATCTGDKRSKAESILACTLDDWCTCPTPKPDLRLDRPRADRRADVRRVDAPRKDAPRADQRSDGKKDGSKSDGKSDRSTLDLARDRAADAP